jgi:hypothetical protein
MKYYKLHFISVLPVLLLSGMLVFSTESYAQESTIDADDVSLTVESVVTSDESMMKEQDSVTTRPEQQRIPQEVLDYELPYPGILPDHPLYKLKLLRDRLLDFLIRDSAKRIEFNLLMADKRLNMGAYLVEKKNYELAEDTVSKAEKYFVKAIDGLYIAREEGRELPDTLPKKLILSVQKHRFVIAELKDKSPDNMHKGYDSTLQTVSENHGRIADFGM